MEEVAGQKEATAEALLANMGAGWLRLLVLVSSSSLECSLLPFLSLQLLPSFSPAGLLQAKRLQNLTGLNARKVLC